MVSKISFSLILADKKSLFIFSILSFEIIYLPFSLIPCKFPEAIDKSIGIKPDLPDELKYVMGEKENYDIISNNLSKTQQYIKEKI